MKALCAGLAGAAWKLLPPPGNVLVYYVDARKFAYFKTSEPEQWRFSFRVSRERFLELTDIPGIRPARYLGRLHWVTVVDVRMLAGGELRDLVASSYEMARFRPRKQPHAGRAGTRPDTAPKRPLTPTHTPPRRGAA